MDFAPNITGTHPDTMFWSIKHEPTKQSRAERT